MVQIKNYSIHDDVEILGQVFHGLEDIHLQDSPFALLGKIEGF
jgi:hypothetical protein